MRRVLAETPGVAHVADAASTRGGWGATVVQLRPTEPASWREDLRGRGAPRRRPGGERAGPHARGPVGPGACGRALASSPSQPGADLVLLAAATLSVWGGQQGWLAPPAPSRTRRDGSRRGPRRARRRRIRPARAIPGHGRAGAAGRTPPRGVRSPARRSSSGRRRDRPQPPDGSAARGGAARGGGRRGGDAAPRAHAIGDRVPRPRGATRGDRDLPRRPRSPARRRAGRERGRRDPPGLDPAAMAPCRSVPCGTTWRRPARRSRRWSGVLGGGVPTATTAAAVRYDEDRKETRWAAATWWPELRGCASSASRCARSEARRRPALPSGSPTHPAASRSGRSLPGAGWSSSLRRVVSR